MNWPGPNAVLARPSAQMVLERACMIKRSKPRGLRNIRANSILGTSEHRSDDHTNFASRSIFSVKHFAISKLPLLHAIPAQEVQVAITELSACQWRSGASSLKLARDIFALDVQNISQPVTASCFVRSLLD
eukprot:scaffold81944_cov38-Prasinocladus_malaysianus.AAC.1